MDDKVNDVLQVQESLDAVTLLFDRPEKRNALNRQLSGAISRALSAAESSARPLVLRSRTPGMFVGGADVAELKERSVEDSLSRLNARLFQQVFEHPWPTVAVVDGAALGGGCELALACDFRITSDRAQWGLPEVRLGIIPSAGGLTRLARLVGVGTANDLVLTGRRVDGNEALELGLVHRAVPAEALDAALAALLHELGRAAPLAARLAKEAMRVDGDRHRLVDAAAQALCIGSAETQERLQALLDRTSPPH